jgi:transposase-like protein
MKWRFSFCGLFRRKPRGPLSPTQCPRCGREMVFVEKFTMTGDDLRIYRCKCCRQEHTVNFGTAMWKIMSDARHKD